jgi:hypothetical protein
MNPRRFNEYNYIDFLVAAQKSYSCLEASKVQPEHPKAPAHDSITRMLHSIKIDGDALWKEAEPMVDKRMGILELDDSTLDKLYAKKIPLVHRHWSGKHHEVVKGINLLTLLWTDGDKHVPCDHRIYDKPNDGLSKNAHFQELVKTAYARGFNPEYVCFDSWYGSLENLKLIKGLGWNWLTRLKPNRLVNPDQNGNVPVARVNVGRIGRVVHLKGYGFIKIFRIVALDGDTEYWATSHLEMSELDRLSTAEKTWMIENYHRGIKQFCGVEKCQARSSNAQRNHIIMALRAFLRLETYSYATGYSWFEAKMQIIREAIREYLKSPKYNLHSTA